MGDELAYIPLGGDRYRAHLIAEAVRAEGFKVELLTADDSGVDPFLAMIQSHRLLVRSEDVDRIQAIVDQS